MRNLFPVTVTLADGTRYTPALLAFDGTKRARIYIANGVAQIAADRDDVETFDRQRGNTGAITFADGATWTFERAAGCGCGNPLKGYQVNW